MKNNLIFIAVLLFTISCEKVINVDLNSSSPQYVIQSVLYSGTADFEVQIAKTTSYFDPQIPEAVQNASVILYDHNNAPHTLLHTEKGIYQLPGFTAEINKTYKLVVEVDSKSFEADVTVPEFVSIENAELTEETDTESGEEEVFYGVVIEFQDPAGSTNYYQFDQRINRNKSEKTGANIIDDFGSNGLLMSEFVFVNGEFNSGDTIWTELRSIDEKSYEYFRTLESIADGGGGDGPGGTAPANPTTNWSNGALGYFSAGNSDYNMIIVP